MYNNAEAQIEVNNELSESFVTEGGVRQGCPMSPFLFICALELMANEVRQDSRVEGVQEPESKSSDKISLFADDSAAFAGNFDEIRWEREDVAWYEKATASKLNDPKSTIILLGKLRTAYTDVIAEHTPAVARLVLEYYMEVRFEILADEGMERYLGDLIGNKVTEEKRFEEGLRKMKEIAKFWNNLNVGCYGRAIVANTLMLAMVKFRTMTNAVSSDMGKQIKEIIREFMWSYKKNGVAWAKMTLPIEQGGVGLLDPKTVFETQLIRIIKLMHTQTDQPWVKWLTRDETKMKRLWSCEGSLYSFAPSKTQMRQLRGSAEKNLGLFENMVLAWHEADGTTSGGYEARRLGRVETDLNRELSAGVQEALNKEGSSQSLDFAIKVAEALSKKRRQPGFNIEASSQVWS
jgi:hypothetical protein